MYFRWWTIISYNVLIEKCWWFIGLIYRRRFGAPGGKHHLPSCSIKTVPVPVCVVSMWELPGRSDERHSGVRVAVLPADQREALTLDDPAGRHRQFIKNTQYKELIHLFNAASVLMILKLQLCYAMLALTAGAPSGWNMSLHKMHRRQNNWIIN